MARERTGKFYFDNEKEVMLSLGLTPTKGSGSGWIEKEDGQNEFLLAQLKSTDADSIRIKKLDIDKLEHNAIVAHKTPVFIIQFLKTGEVFLMGKPMDLPVIAEYIKTGIVKEFKKEIGKSIDSLINGESKEKPVGIISSGDREEFWSERRQQFGSRNKNKNSR